MIPSKSEKDKNDLRSDGRILFLFVLITFVLWLSLRLSLPSELEISARLDYQIPNGYTLYQGTPDTMSIKVSGKTISMLFLDKKPSIPVTLGKRKSAILSRSDLINAARLGLSKELNIIEIHPTRIAVKLDTLSVKEVPIIIKHKLTLAEGFSIIKEVEANPATVKISGFVEDLKTINSWNTELIQIENLRADYSQKVKLQSTDSDLIHLGITETDIQIVVDQYIEKQLIVPFRQAGLDKFNIIPEELNIQVTIPMRYYDAFTAEDVGIEIDSLESSNASKSVKLATLPDYIKVLDVFPDSVKVFLRDETDLN